tara:strand:- start:218 stop:520 length:303 start_codon:yes stop_codon:yes gene_type:complete
MKKNDKKSRSVFVVEVNGHWKAIFEDEEAAETVARLIRANVVACGTYNSLEPRTKTTMGDVPRKRVEWDLLPLDDQKVWGHEYSNYLAGRKPPVEEVDHG